MTGDNTVRNNLVKDEPDLASMGLRERKKLIRLQRIVAAARKLFIDKGFTTTTIQDIAVEADVGLGTLYLYAKSKEDLLVLVFKDDILKMIDESYAGIAPGEPLLDQLMAFFEGHISYHMKDQTLSRTVLKELSFSTTEQRRKDIDQIMNSTYAKLMKLIERARRDGRVQKELYTGTMAWSTFALYYHLLQGYLCGFHTEEEFRKSLRNALAALLD
ncbi:MAG: TetR/AcrR family transcriptional regulator [Pseudohongiella sp.]|uniref:TetR/AcrR family transcriptional regulator n=1 Tax=Pseudohongiella sp. TaxID=1979412 RepID=UPI0034A02C58